MVDNKDPTWLRGVQVYKESVDSAIEVAVDPEIGAGVLKGHFKGVFGASHINVSALAPGLPPPFVEFYTTRSHSAVKPGPHIAMALDQGPA